MAERSLTIRVSLKDYEKVQQALVAMGAEGHRALARIEDGSKKASGELRAFGGAADAMESRLLRLGAAIGAAFSVREITRMADSYTLLTGKLKLVTGSAEELASTQRKLFQMAQENRTNLEATATLYTRLAQSVNNLGVNQQQLLQLSDTISKSLRVGGATAQEAAAGVIQLSQALSAGRLQGDEFRSVLENMPRVAKALEDALGVTRGELREMAKAGELTSKQLATALLSQSKVIEDEFGRLPKTVGEAHTQLGNALAQFAGTNGPIQFVINKYVSLIDVIAGVAAAMSEFEQRLYDPAEQARFNVRQTEFLLKGDPNNPELQKVLADARAKLAAQVDAEARGSYEASKKRNAQTLAAQKSNTAGGDSAKAADKQALRDYIDSLEEENRLVRLTARDRAVAEKVLRAENAARRDGKKLTDEQRAQVEGLAKAQYDYAEAVKDAEEQAKRAAEAQKEMWRPVEHALDRVQDSFADMLESGKFSFSSLVGIAKRAAAEIAAAMVFRPIIGGVAGSLSGALLPGISGAVTGTGGGGAGSLLSLSGLSNLGSGLLNGFSTPLLNPGIAFDIGSALGLSGSTVGSLHSGLANFTPTSALSSLGGSLLANALGLSGKYSNVTGTIGGLAGTFFGGPIGGAVGSFLGSAVGGLFGGGKPHPQASFASLINPDGSLAIQNYGAKHMDTSGVEAMAQQLGGFLQALSSVSDVRFKNYGVHGIINPSFSGFQTNHGQIFGFNPEDASSVAGSFRDLALFLARNAEVVDEQLVRALQNVQVQGRDAAGVLQAVTTQLTGIAGLKQLADALLTDPATTNLSPEEQRRRAGEAFAQAGAQFTAGTAGADAVSAAALAYLQTSQAYAGRASGTYAGDLDLVTGRLRQLSAGVMPSFASGGEFSPGIFKVHPGEIVMTSSTPGRVENPETTRRLLGGNDLMLYQALNRLTDMVGQMIAAQQAGNRLLGRVTAA